jgi:hypothetical protein
MGRRADDQHAVSHAPGIGNHGIATPLESIIAIAHEDVDAIDPDRCETSTAHVVDGDMCSTIRRRENKH